MLYALDASTLIFLLTKEKSVVKKVSEVIQDESVVLTIPPFSYYEVLRGYLYKNAENKIAMFEKMYDDFYMPTVDERDLMRKAAELYSLRKKKGRSIDEGDIIIASWCILSGATLVTDNVKHFIDIDGLNIVNWKVRDLP
ncbi:MAG: PIN domain-containing protein [Oscillospiraceae bacterium]|nr:PIN domain-containing protein [Oscillospiraceae bacterium]